MSVSINKKKKEKQNAVKNGQTFFFDPFSVPNNQWQSDCSHLITDSLATDTVADQELGFLHFNWPNITPRRLISSSKNSFPIIIIMCDIMLSIAFSKSAIMIQKKKKKINTPSCWEQSKLDHLSISGAFCILDLPYCMQHNELKLP